MPNYKQCRFCSEKYVPLRDEIICPKCSGAVVYAVQMPVGSPVPIMHGNMPDEVIKSIKDAIGIIEDEEIVVIAKEPEVNIPLPPEPVEVAIVEASPKDLQEEKDLEVMEEAIVELDKGENAEIIGPSAQKPDVPEEKPDAPS